MFYINEIENKEADQLSEIIKENRIYNYNELKKEDQEIILKLIDKYDMIHKYQDKLNFIHYLKFSDIIKKEYEHNFLIRIFNTGYIGFLLN